MFRNARVIGFSVLVLFSYGVAAQATVIDMVGVGNPGNAVDSTGYGVVDYGYKIGKYEVTAGQYTDFLNAKAASDPNALYNPKMQEMNPYACNIVRSGDDGSYTYSVDSANANRPVNYVSFWDAARFTNWMSNGQGNGDTETGAYTLTSGGIANNTVTRNAGWKVAVASENEWYKAAYYDPNKPGGAGYWLQPTKNDVAPGTDKTELTNPGNNANTGGSDSLTTPVGQFYLSASAYGTFDQGGNVWEINDDIHGLSRGHNGGATDGNVWYTDARAMVHTWVATQEDFNGGFRVVSSVPEPGSVVLLTTGLIGLLCYAWRTRK